MDIPLSGDERWILAQFLAGARTALGEDEFAEEWAEGKTMSLDAAVAYAGRESSADGA